MMTVIKKFLNSLIIGFILVEVFAFSALFFLKITSKLSIPIIDEENILFSRYDLPHPSISDLFFQYPDIPTFTDPNVGWYQPNADRWGVERPYLNDQIDKEEINIYMFGGSTVEGDGSTREKSLVKYLEKDLNTYQGKCKLVKVHNEGVSGYYSKQEYLTTVLKVLKYTKPDYLIYVSGVNDHIGFMGERAGQNDYFFSNDWSSRELAITQILENSRMSLFSMNVNTNRSERIRNILSNTFAGKLANTVLLSLNSNFTLSKNSVNPNKFNYKSEELLVHNALYYKDLIDKSISETKIKSLHILQPTMIYKQNPSNEELKILNGESTNYGSFNKTYWSSSKKFFDYYRDSLKSASFNSMDLSDLFKESGDQDFIDHAHYTENANLKIARAIGKKIAAEFKCKKN